MALIKCIDCGNMISDLAANCPHCGRPIALQPAQMQQAGYRPVYNQQAYNTTPSDKWSKRKIKKTIIAIAAIILILELGVICAILIMNLENKTELQQEDSSNFIQAIDSATTTPVQQDSSIVLNNSTTNASQLEQKRAEPRRQESHHNSSRSTREDAPTTLPSREASTPNTNNNYKTTPKKNESPNNYELTEEEKEILETI